MVASNLRWRPSKLIHWAALVAITITPVVTMTLAAVWTGQSSVLAGPQTRTLSSGIADSTNALGAKWRRVDFTAQRTGTATFQLSWTGTADMRFEIYRANNTKIGGNITSGAGPKAFSTALTANTTYYATVWAYSGVGNYTFAITEVFPDTDTTAPSVPQDLASPSQTVTTASLTWSASTDDVGVAGYQVYRDGTLVVSPSGTSVTDTGLAPATSYVYQVRSIDAAGNLSEVSASLSVTTQSTPTSRPNVVVINLDDMRADSLQYMLKVRQWMADGGTNFTKGYVSTPSCCPSRASLMSGRYVHNNGQYQHLNVGLDLNLTTQRYLHDAGYFTGHAGKFVHWYNINQVAPHWDRWTYFKGGYDNVQMNFDGTVANRPGNSTVITFDRAINYLNDFEQRDDAKPFYMQLAPVAPHSPSTPESQYASASVPALVQTPAHSETDRSDKPQWVRWINSDMTEAQSTRTAMIRTLYTVDDQVDRFMTELQAKGELDNTMVIFTSDNGYFWGEHQLRSKFLPYTEAVSVPLLVRWPGHVTTGATDTRYVTHADVLPTILAATGVTQNYVALDGKDILSGHNRPTRYTEYYFDTGNGNGVPTWAAIENGEYLYVEYYGQNNGMTSTTFREYYNMVTDPYQLQNLLGDTLVTNDPPNLAQLSADLAAAKTCVGAACQ
jgi:arylsulfatase A-like enzyme